MLVHALKRERAADQLGTGERALIVVACVAAICVGFAIATGGGRSAEGAVTSDIDQLDSPAITVTKAAGHSAALATYEGLTPTRRPHRKVNVRYTVAFGDTLWGLASRYYVDVASGMRRIRERNGLRRMKLLAGETLILPRVDAIGS
jgi:LysM repeat protein